jgi:hypothetical protein
MPLATRIIALLALLMAAAGAQSEIYKWVDEDGVTHYSQQPPPGGEARVIQPGISAPPEPPSGDGDGNAGANGGSGTAGGEGRQTQSMADFCKELREQAQLLASDREVKVKQSQDTLVTLDAEARQQRLQDLQGQIQQHCSDQ